MKLCANVRVSDVGKRFEKRWVLRHVDFELKMGDSLVVSGRNGSGKSTLLKLIAGLIAPTEGEIALSVDNQKASPDERRRWLGFASPEMQLYPNLTGIEHLRFFGDIRGLCLAASELSERLTLVGLDAGNEAQVSAYSTGMKQRLKLALAVLHSPPILLLDEPGSNLDESGKQALKALIERQKQSGVLLIATNDADELSYGELSLALGA